MERRLPRSHTQDWQRSSDDSGDGLLLCCFDFCARLKKAQAKPFRPHHQHFSEPTGMRVLAFAPERRVVENGNGRLPGGTLVLFAAATP